MCWGGGGLAVVIRQQGQPQARSLRPLPQGGVVASSVCRCMRKCSPASCSPYLHPSGKGTAADGVDDGIALPVSGSHAIEMLLIPSLLQKPGQGILLEAGQVQA